MPNGARGVFLGAGGGRDETIGCAVGAREPEELFPLRGGVGALVETLCATGGALTGLCVALDELPHPLACPHELDACEKPPRPCSQAATSAAQSIVNAIVPAIELLRDAVPMTTPVPSRPGRHERVRHDHTESDLPAAPM